MQAQQVALEAKQEGEAWARMVQQLASDPVHSVESGQAVVLSVLETLQTLEEQQRNAFEDLAAKDDALGTAAARIGEPHCRSSVMQWWRILDSRALALHAGGSPCHTSEACRA